MEQPSSIKFGILMMLIGWIQGYDLTCPGLGHWNFRRTLTCKEINNYTCIYDDVNQSIIENCDGPVPLGKGFKAIHRGNIDRESCIDARYQPFSFSTAWYSKCVFLKSVCTEEGQVTVGKGITTEDRICGCDYQNMYAFIVKPSHLDNCKPMEDDCSCYKHLCSEEQRYLSKDYKCVEERGYYSTVNPDTAMSGTKVVSKDSIQKDDSRNGDRSNIYRYTILALSAGVMVYIGFLTYFLFTRPYLEYRCIGQSAGDMILVLMMTRIFLSKTNSRRTVINVIIVNKNLGQGSRNKTDEELDQRFSPNSGYWSGSFILHGKSYGFGFILKCKDCIIKGKGVDEIDASKIKGTWNSNNGRVEFIKHYENKNYDVNYSGHLSPDSRTMSGHYVVKDRSGEFTMSLPPIDKINVVQTN